MTRLLRTLRRWARIDWLEYSIPEKSSRTLKLMLVGLVSTPSSRKILWRFGYVRSLWTMKPVSTA